MESKEHNHESIVEDVREREGVAERGESESTPAIVLGGVWLICAVAVAVVLALALLAFWLAS